MEGLGLRGDVFLTQLVNFVILLLLLRMFLYQPIVKRRDRHRGRTFFGAHIR